MFGSRSARSHDPSSAGERKVALKVGSRRTPRLFQFGRYQEKGGLSGSSKGPALRR